MSIVILGVDLGKSSWSIVGADAAGAVVIRRTMRRQTLIDYVTSFRPAWSRWKLAAVRIISSERLPEQKNQISCKARKAF